MQIVLMLCSAIAVMATIGIVMSLLFETLRFFGKVSFTDFLLGTHWSPQSAFEGAGSESGLADNSRVFGAIALFAGTPADYCHRHVGGCTHRFDGGDLFVGLFQPNLSRLCQTFAGNTGPHTNRGLRIFCRPDGCPGNPRLGRIRRFERFF